MTRFTDRLWQETAELYRATLDLPFNRELAAGTLPRETFLFYMIQDAHYLVAFSRALATIAAKAPVPDAQVRFAHAAHEAIVVERALHEGFFREFGVTPEDYAGTPRSPTCEAYANFLVATAWQESYPVGVAAVLPCFQIYHEVGLALHGRSAPDNPYRRWIDTYADPAFGEAVRGVIAATDAAHDAAGPSERLAMRAAYRQAARYEWLFWDSAWRREPWPV